jgi:hypothetical protein
MQKAASTISDTVTFHLERRMEEWVSRIESAAERIAVAMESVIAESRKTSDEPQTADAANQEASGHPLF